MRKLIYIILLISGFCFSQSETDYLLLASQQQYEAESVNLYTESNVLSSDVYEADATTNISGVGVTLHKETSDLYSGSYALKFTSTDGSSDRMEFNFASTNGATYEMKFSMKKESGAGLTLTAWTGVTDTTPPITPSPILTDNWEDYTITFTANSTNVLARFYNMGSSGTYLIMDNLTIKEI